MPRTIKALRDCAWFLSEMLRIGWKKSDLDWLEALWWDHHDRQGRLVGQIDQGCW